MTEPGSPDDPDSDAAPSLETGAAGGAAPDGGTAAQGGDDPTVAGEAQLHPRANTDLGPLTRTPPRALGILLALAAAACLVTACFSHRWLANKHRGDLGYSPLSFQQCRPTCETITNFQVARIANESPFAEDRVAAAFPLAGLATFIVLLVAAAGLAAAALLALAGARPDLPVSPTTFALLGIMMGLISGCVFVATKPGAVGSVGVSWSFWAFGIGSVAGIAGAQLLAKQIRPADPDLLSDAMNPDQF